LIELGLNSARFSEQALVHQAKHSDFDSTIRRFALSANKHEKNFEETCSRLFDHVVNAGSKGALRISHSDMLATPGRVGSAGRRCPSAVVR
jgi:hypothetical protein